jgi:hypothetical protein
MVEIFRASPKRFFKEPVDSAALRTLLIERDAHTSLMLEHESNRREPCTTRPVSPLEEKERVDALVLVEDLADLV